MNLLILITDLVLTTLMAVFLAYIAYQQLETNRNKLKLDLYIKRFEVYSISLNFYQELADDGTPNELIKKFIEQKEAAKFLFSTDPSIYLLLNEMHKKSFKINNLKNNRDSYKENPESLSCLIQDSSESMRWFGSAVKDLSRKMEPFLKV